MTGVSITLRASQTLPLTTAQVDGNFQNLKAGIDAASNASGITFTPIGAGAVSCSVEDVLRESESVKRFGAVGDGIADDTSAIQRALDAGLAFLPQGTYRITGTIYIDYSKTSLHGNAAKIVSGVAANSPSIIVFSTAQYGANGQEPYTKNYIRKAMTGVALIGIKQATSPAGGTGFIGLQVGRSGDAYFQSGDAVIEKCAIYGFDTQVLMADNGWRVQLKGVAITGGGYPIWYSSPANSGEVMSIDNCWVVGWTDVLLINGGYFIFDKCSLFGSASGKMVLQNSAMVTLRDTNSELSNTRNTPAFSIETTSRLIVDGGSLVFDSDMTAPVFQGDSSYGMLTLQDVSLPLYGANLKYEQNAWGDNQVRSLVQRGTNLLVQARGCFPKAGVLNNQPKLQSIIGGRNRLANGSAETGAITPWQVGGGTCVVSATNPRNSSKCFNVTVGALYQDVKVAGDTGKWFALAFWVKVLAGTGTVGNPKVQFLDVGGNSLAIYTVAAIDGSHTSWEWYAYNWFVPDGADVARVILDGGAMASASLAFDDVYFDVY